MKRTALSLVVLVLFAVPRSPLQAQWLAGFTAGPTLTNVTGDFVVQSDWSWGLAVGGQLQYRAHKNLAVELGANFLQKGSELGQTSQGDFGSLRLRYLEVPLILVLRWPVSPQWHLRVFAGGTLGLNLSCDVKGVGNQWSSCKDSDAGVDAESVEWSIPFGGGLAYDAPFANSSLVLDVRYVLGMSDVFNDVDLKTRVWEFLARWNFGI